MFAFPRQILAAGIAAACLAGGAAHAADIKFGFAGPLTGPQAHYGEDMQNGLALAIEEANKQGIKVGGSAARFVLVSRDDQADPRVGVQVAQQLVDEDVNGILGHFNSGTTIPASRVYHDAGLPQIRGRVAQRGLQNVSALIHFLFQLLVNFFELLFVFVALCRTDGTPVGVGQGADKCDLFVCPIACIALVLTTNNTQHITAMADRGIEHGGNAVGD